MEKFKKLFPLTAKFSENGNKLAIGLLIYVGIWLIGPWIVGTAIGLVMFLLGLITFGLTNILTTPLAFVAGWVVPVYCIAGVVLLILEYAKANKSENVIETKAEEISETNDAE